MIKGFLRGRYGKWALALTTEHLRSGAPPETLRLPFGKPAMVTNLFRWVGEAYSALLCDTEQRQKIHSCWESTKLLTAWEQLVQVEAITREAELFPNLSQREVWA